MLFSSEDKFGWCTRAGMSVLFLMRGYVHTVHPVSALLVLVVYAGTVELSSRAVTLFFSSHRMLCTTHASMIFVPVVRSVDGYIM